MEDQSSSTSWFGRKKMAAIVFGTLMIGLPLGGGVFYSSLSPDQPANNAGSGGGSGEYLYNPPVGNGYVPREGQIPTRTLLDSELSKDQQVVTLVQGGPQQTQQGLRPAVLLQYSCSDCPEVRQGLEQIADSFNSGGNWVYVAPYSDMDSTISISGFRSLTTLDELDTERINTEICNKLADLPLKCIEDEFSSNQS